MQAHAQEGKRVMSSGATSSTSSTTVLPSTGIGRTRNECQSGTNIYSGFEYHHDHMIIILVYVSVWG